MQSFELFQEQVPAFAGKTGKSVYLCITLDKARTAICSILLLRFYAVWINITCCTSCRALT